jgi:hypothetical protein
MISLDLASNNGNVFKNNILIGNNLRNNNYQIYYNPFKNGLTGVIFNSNLIYDSRTKYTAYYGNKSRSIDYLETVQPIYFSDNLTEDPQFTNLSSESFTLLPTSPCIDAGTNVGLIQDYYDNFVPQGNSVDIGAFEYCIISSPKNLRIQ